MSRRAGARWAALCLLLAVVRTQGAELPQYAEAVHQGVASCASSVCHGSATERITTSVLQNEFVIWTRMDPHAGAYRTLLGDASRRIARNLGLANAHEAAICLDCHADNVPEARRGADFRINDGVGCEACHGGGEHWLATHAANGNTHADNVARGMYPTADVERRAVLCLSCHLGTADKFATHRIMGAGHPRLTFELSTFSALQPPHWAFDDDYDRRKGITSEFDTWTRGLLTAARQSLELLNSPHIHQNAMFPEIGLFDCHACHRSMAELRWETTVLTAGVAPGAMRVNDANFVLLLPLAEVLAGAVHDPLLAGIRALNLSVGESRSAVVAATGRLAAAIDDLEVSLAAFGADGADPAARQRILDGLLARAARGDYRDYVAAEQAAMAMDLLLISVGRLGDVSEGMNAIFASVEDDAAFRPTEFAAAAERLRGAL